MENGKIVCDACRHHCILKDGEVGICGVRANNKGELVSLVYGRPLSISLDPIEKKPLYHFLPGSHILSIGTFGCNFSCKFCQNYDISQTPKRKPLENIKTLIDKHSYTLSPQEIVNIAVSRGIKSIAYTYNEPTVFAEYFLDIAKIAKEEGIKNVLVSNGYFSEKLRKIIPKYIDAINIDLKSMSKDFYLKLVGGKLEYVTENIKYLYKKVWLELTTLLIPNENDSDEEIKKIANFIKDISSSIPWHISRFFPAYKMMNTPPTPIETLERAYRIAKEVGLKYVYIGNYPSDKENTYCPECGKLLISRKGYNINVLMKDGMCECGEKIEGVWI